MTKLTPAEFTRLSSAERFELCKGQRTIVDDFDVIVCGHDDVDLLGLAIGTDDIPGRDISTQTSSTIVIDNKIVNDIQTKYGRSEMYLWIFEEEYDAYINSLTFVKS